MNRGICVIQSPCATVSGYGFMARDIIHHIIDLDIYDVKLISTSWGACPMNALDGTNAKDGELIKRVVVPPIQLPRQPELYIQITIPNEFQPMGKFNLGITAGIETNMCSKDWIDGCNRMDTVWGISEHAVRVLKDTVVREQNNQTGAVIREIKVEKPLEVLHNCVHTDVFKKIDGLELEKSIDDELSSIKEKFCFLFVGHWLKGGMGEDRKNIALLVKLFCETFQDVVSQSRPALILKTSGADFSILDREEQLNKIRAIRAVVGPNCPNVYLVHGDLTLEEMNSLYNHPKVKAHINFTKGEGFCVLPGTKIPTTDGLVNIEDVSSKHTIWTHDKVWKNVHEPLNRQYSGSMYKIQTYGGTDPISFTPNHQVFTKWGERRVWKAVEDLTENDVLCLPLPVSPEIVEMLDVSEYIDKTNAKIYHDKIDYQHSDKSEKIHIIPRFIKPTAALGRILGMYLSEGCISNGAIMFCINKNEVNTLGKQLISDFQEVFLLNGHSIREHPIKNSAVVIFYSAHIASFLNGMCGKFATQKKLNQVVYNLPDECVDALLSSIIMGDGYINIKRKPSISLELVNDNLIREIRWLLLRQGIYTAYNSGNKKGFSKIVSRIRITNRQFFNKMIEKLNLSGYEIVVPSIISNSIHLSKGRSKSWIEDGFLYTKIKSIHKFDYNGPVYNLSVKVNESYSTENFAVHNCRPLLEASMSEKPIIASGWSGQLDFLNPTDAILLAGELRQVEGGAVWDNIIIKESSWFNVDPVFAQKAMKLVFKDYDRFLPGARKLAKINAEQFSYDVIKNKTKELLEKYVPHFEIPQEVTELPLILPKLRKLEG